jgi:hypothetical protein
MNVNKKKGNGQIGIGIIIMAFLLLFGSVFFNGENTNSKNNYLNNRDNTNSNNNIDSDYLFLLNNTILGRQNKITVSYPNFELGSKEENNKIYLGNNFILQSNPFSKTRYSFDLNIDKYNETEELLFYFNVNWLSGSEDFNIIINNQSLAKSSGSNAQMPISIKNGFRENNRVIIELNKPPFYDIFDWNKAEISQFEIIERRVNSDNSQREFNFQIDKSFLNRTYLDVVIGCENINELQAAIKIEINDYIVSNSNPKCQNRNKLIQVEVPINILEEEKNSIMFETDGYYDVAYSLNKIYFNDKQEYRFDINNFNSIVDVVLYGDFDKEVIDIKLNGKLLTLNKNEILPVIRYLRIGKNEIEILTNKVEIEELAIEKTDLYYYS